MSKSLRAALVSCVLVGLFCESLTAGNVVDYDIVYVRQPRFGDNTNTTWPEIFHPGRIDPGADLVLLHPDGTEETLVAGGVGSVTDPFVSFDGQYVYYSLFHDVRPENLNYQRGYLSYDGADIFRINLATREIEQLTHGEFTPNTGAGVWDEQNPVNPPDGYNSLGYGMLNLGPCPLPDGRIAFTSNRNGFFPPKDFTNPTLQLFVMDADGSNVECIAPMNIGSALHPTPLRDGRIMFSSYESQGLRDRRLWGVWAIQPDGRNWSPLVSAFRGPQAFHFFTQMSDESLVVVDYYNLNNNGFGAMYRFPIDPPPGEPRFHSAFPDENPAIDQTIGQGFLYPFRMPFTPRGMYSMTPFTHGLDEAAPVGGNGVRVGKFTHPSGAPNGDLLCVWTPGPANDLNRPTPLPYYDAGLYIIRDGVVPQSPDDFDLIINDPAYNEAWPRAVVPYADVHGVPEPEALAYLPNDGTAHTELPAGTPHGLVGSSSMYKRESFPGYVVQWADTFDGLDAFNTSENGQTSNWGTQGSDAGLYSDSEIWAIRILSMEPFTHRSYGPDLGRHFVNHATERLRILGEIPVRKFDGGEPIFDPEGNPDTSFLAKLPADTPFTFQLINQDGMNLTMAQTWHQVRPGEVRVDCGGCHAHSQLPLLFEDTAAGQPGYAPVDIATATPLLTRDPNGDPDVRVESTTVANVEFLRDVRPLLQRSCVPCHTQNDASPPGDLVFDDYALYDGLPGDYARLAADDGSDSQWGIAPIINVGQNHPWRQNNASRYVRKFQSRRSLLVWKVFGERRDGWTNADHPTEAVPGDVGTLPQGASPNEADIDFVGDIMPPPGSNVPPLSHDERLTIVRWIDLGCPIDVAAINGHEDVGWFLDDLRPTLTVSAPRGGINIGPLEQIRIGIADAYTGLVDGSLSVTSDLDVNGRAAGQELADLAVANGEGIYAITLDPPLVDVEDAHVYVAVSDQQGNITRVDRRFAVVETAGIESARSCLAHGEGQNAVEMCLDLSVTNGVEPRLAGMTKLTIEADADLDASTVADTNVQVACVQQPGGTHHVTLENARTMVVTLDESPVDLNCCTITFDGVRSASGALLVGAVDVVLLSGDLNFDGGVTGADAALIKPHFGEIAGVDLDSPQWDMDGSGAVTGADFVLVKPLLGHIAADCN